MTSPDNRHFADAALQASRRAGTSIWFDKAQRFNAAIAAARFRLDNGLRIVLQPDRRAPVFAFQSWFKVGSKHEDPNRTGLAHLFEHLMFKGTRNHPTGQFDREMERRGTQTNAATWVDWTFYTEALAARGDNLKTVLDFEVDRLSNLVLDEQTFASELEVVKNERRMSVEDHVPGLIDEQLAALAFTRHPYRWPVIGRMEHLEAASLHDVERFYRSFYAPNNAILVLTGELDVVETLAQIAARYAPVAAQPVPVFSAAPEPEQTEPRWCWLERPTMTTQIGLGFHAPAESAQAFPALQVLGEILFTGDNARLYERLVTREHMATDVQGGAGAYAEPGLFEISLSLRNGVDPRAAIEVVQEELQAVGRELTAEQVDKARNNLELGLLESFQDAEDCAEMLGHYETNYNDFGLAYDEIERCRSVGAAEVDQVARQIFKPSNRSAVIVQPEN